MRRSAAGLLSYSIIFIIQIMLILPAAGCRQELLNPGQPVTLSMWHNYGGQMKSLMDEMVDEFNATVGAGNGIIISVTAISGSKELHDMLVAAADEVPGAIPLPDITTAYPRTAVLLKQHNKLVNLDDYFDEDKLAEFVPAFVAEGRIGGKELYVFPIAKSTEVLFVNQTLFDRFAAENKFSYDDLKTFEGIASASLAYLAWTDEQTPDIPGDGKAFFMADSLFNQALVGSRQLGEYFLLIEDGSGVSPGARLNLSSTAHQRIWDINYTASVYGGFAAFDGYSSDLFKTGDLVCSVGSTAGILFYPEVITYPDNTKDEVSFAILPYPVYVNGSKTALQRGGGMCVIKSETAREYAASLFLDWFTRPEQNLRFTLSSGYLPVTSEAFNQLRANDSTVSGSDSLDLPFIENPRIRQQLKTILQMYDEYKFFYAPHAQNSDELQRTYEEQVLELIHKDRGQLAMVYGPAGYTSAAAADALDAMSEQARQELARNLAAD